MRMTEEKVYSFRTFKWKKGLKYFAYAIVLFLAFKGIGYVLSLPSWSTHTIEEVLSHKNLKIEEVELVAGDTFWSIQTKLEPNANMHRMYDAFLALNGLQDGEPLIAGRTYQFAVSDKKEQ